MRPSSALSLLMASKICRTISGASPSDGSSSSRQPRPAHQRARDRQHLLLAARQRAAALGEALLQPREQRQHAVEIVRRIRPAAATVAPICRFSSTVMRGKMRRPSGDCASLSRAISCVGSCVMSRPSKTISPSRARGLPHTVIIRVDLPAPLAPISATISPALTSRSTPLSAWHAAVKGGRRRAPREAARS